MYYVLFLGNTTSRKDLNSHNEPIKGEGREVMDELEDSLLDMKKSTPVSKAKRNIASHFHHTS